MKKNIYITLLSLIISSSVFSQASKGDVEIGFDFGYNFSNIMSAKGIAQGTDGFNFAGSFDYYYSNRWSIKGKVIYDQKGWDGSFYFGPVFWIPSEYNKVYSLNYITVPVMANWHFGKKRNWYLNFGPYVGFLLNAEDITTGNSIKKNLNSTDFGIAYGIGVKIPLNNNLKIFFEMDDQGGIKNIFNNYNYNNVPNYHYYEEYGINLRGSFNFGLLYQFNHNSAVQK